MKITDEDYKKHREVYERRNKFSFKVKMFLSDFLLGFLRVFKNRGGYIIFHLIFTIIALIDGSREAFGLMYVNSVILYEIYVYSLREKLGMNED